MSCATPPLTSTIDELYNILKQTFPNQEIVEDVVDLNVPGAPNIASASGRYKYEVLDSDGLLYDSGNWKPNLILNCGLDKISDMSWAQVFQFAVAGTDPTPTKESWEDTDLTVELLSSSTCPAPTYDGTPCYASRSPGGLLARAVTSRREVTDAAPAGNCLQRTFGLSGDSGKLLYLRDLDLQYNVLTSCPVYQADPVQPEVTIVSECGTLSAAYLTAGNPGGEGGLSLNGGQGYMAMLSADNGLPWTPPGGSGPSGLVGELQSFDLPSGDCNAPLLCAYPSTHPLSGKAMYINPVAGIEIDPPSLRAPDLLTTITGDTGILATDIDILDAGDGFPCGSVPIQFGAPATPTACRGDWMSGKNASKSEQIPFGNFSGIQRNSGLPYIFIQFVNGQDNGHNLLRYGSHWNVAREATTGEKVDDLGSFQEFFSKLVIHHLFRKTSAGLGGGLGAHTPIMEYNRQSVDFHQLGDHIPGYNYVDLGGSAGRYGIPKVSGIHKFTHDSTFKPQHWLPWWIDKGYTTMDTGTAGSGGDYIAEFGNWADFKQNVLKATGPTTKSTGNRGNLFSGIPVGALNGLPPYTYDFSPGEVDFGNGIDSVDPYDYGAKNMMIIPAENTGDPTVIHDDVYVPGNADRSVTALSDEFIEFNIVDFKIKSVTFNWQVMYDHLTHASQSIPSVPRRREFPMTDKALITGYEFDAPKINFLPASSAKAEAIITDGEVTSVNIISGGFGYCPGEVVTTNVLSPIPARQATARASMSTINGSVTAIHIIDPGSGYSTKNPVKICFPEPPEPEIVSYDLVLEPVETYETVNNGHFHNRIPLPSPAYKADIFNVDQTYLFDQYKTHAWYLTGKDVETNATYCGTDFLSAGNQMALTRTFDFYMELQPVTYTEIGFKESPAARELFSRIALEDPIYLCPGQFLRLSYQLLITFEPGDVPRYKEVIADGDWYNGVYSDGTKVLSGYECMQGNGMCTVGEDGVANPYDITGFANEPFAPGSTNLGPQYGYVNRWKNGDTRLSHPTMEYNNDVDNPWLLGGDQASPPDWAAKYWDSPTVNYRPRNFKTYIEWPAQTMDIPDVANTDSTIKWKQVNIPAGPELSLERDAFDHWFTKAPPSAKSTITFTNFAANEGTGKGRWDFLVTKGYVADVYPNLMGNTGTYQDIREPGWIDTYRFGEPVPSTPSSRSAPGVFMGPVLEYTGRDGALHDPVSVYGSRLSRNVSALKHPYGGHYLVMLDPVNTGLGQYDTVTITYPYCQGGTMTWTSPPFCYRNLPPLNTGSVNTDYAWLQERQSYYGFGSLKADAVYPVDPYAGGGVFTKLDSWAPWTHTPLITSYELAAVIGPERKLLRPDTAGNWSKAEAIPVAGSSAWLSTSDDDFEVVGSYANRSHTTYGAVCGLPGVDNDFSDDLSFETPCYFIEKYKRGSGQRIKRAVFETSFANLTGIKCIGIGPTSTTLRPRDMTDAARFNTYVFKFGDVNTPADYKGYNNLSTYKLSLDFKYVWYRNLKI